MSNLVNNLRFFQSEGWPRSMELMEVKFDAMCRLFQRQSGQLQRPCWLRILWVSVGVPSKSLYCNCAIFESCTAYYSFSPFPLERWIWYISIYRYIDTCNFWRTLHELQEYIEKIFPLCSRRLPIINIYSTVGFLGCATWWTLYNKVSRIYRQTGSYRFNKSVCRKTGSD